MKRVLSIFAVVMMCFTLFAQSVDNFNKIALSVVMPENFEGLDASQLSKLESKIIQIATTSGLAANGYNNNFVIYPKFEIYNNEVVEGGMQNITVVTADLSLFIKQVDNNILFSAISKPIKGSGSNKKLAITNAISSIQTNNPEFESFISKGKTRIVEYYETKCSDILKKSDTYIRMKQYEQAIGLLMSVPEEVSSCYTLIQDKSIVAYKAYEAQNCAVQIQKAKMALASNDYIGALNVLGEIDPSTPCYKEVQILANSAAQKVDVEERKLWNFQLQQYNDERSLERQRINAIKEIATAYYKNQVSTVSYNYIIR